MTNATDAKVEQVQRWSAEVQHGTLGSATRHYADPHGSWVHHDDYAALQAEVARLREDAARLDWLARAGDVSFSIIVDAPHDGEYSLHHDLPGSHAFGATLRAAIDAAIQGSANGQG